MYYMYVLQSLKDKKYYVGSCENLEERLIRHNQGRETATKHRTPFNLIYSESYNTRTEALNRERQIKSYKGGNAFKKLINRE